MPTPALHILCAKLGLKGYAAGFLSDPWSTDLSEFGRIVDSVLYGVDPRVGSIPYGFVSLGEEGPILTIRGTQMPDGSLVEWLDDFDAFLEACPFAPGAQWHRGFGSVFKTFYIVTPDSKVHVFIDYLAQFKGLLCHGHSLGAPLATFAAAQLQTQPPILFASPKPGDLAFRSLFQQSVGVPASYANPNDAVPKVPITVDFPFRFEDFQHVAPLTLLSADSVTPAISADWGSSHSLENYLLLLEAIP